MTSPVPYEYAAEDRLVTPHAYMYTPYKGRPFLEAYFASRAELAKGAEGSIAALRTGVSALPASPPGTSAARVREAVESLLRGPSEPAAAVVAEFVRRYEVSKKIHRSYPDGRKGDGEFLAMDAYLLLAAGCTLVFRGGGTLKYLNCLLKLGDLIVSRRASLSAAETALASALAAAETEAVRTLMREQGVAP